MLANELFEISNVATTIVDKDTILAAYYRSKPVSHSIQKIKIKQKKGHNFEMCIFEQLE